MLLFMPKASLKSRRKSSLLIAKPYKRIIQLCDNFFPLLHGQFAVVSLRIRSLKVFSIKASSAGPIVGQLCNFGHCKNEKRKISLSWEIIFKSTYLLVSIFGRRVELKESENVGQQRQLHGVFMIFKFK